MDFDALRSLRRELHQIPEPAWCEFQTTARLVDELEACDVDTLHVGPDAIDSSQRTAVPDEDELAAWHDRAREAGVREDVLEQVDGGQTGVVAVLDCGPGPTVGLRVDIDALPREEATTTEHTPAAEGFRSEHEGVMHACGHDGHMAIGLGVIEAVKESEFQGTLKVLFQPAEEVVGGGEAMATGGHLDDVDYLLAVHLGLDHPTGEIVAGIDGFLAVSHLEATFHGEPAHAGARPQEGRNAIQALATAVENCSGISRHADGGTRINVGIVDGGTATNIVAEEARLVAEVRGETTELRAYMADRARTVIESAAEMHDCTVDIETGATAPSAASDDELASIVGDVGATVDGVDRVLDSDHLGGSEDATYLLRSIQKRGGLACYVGVGTDHPGGHHTATFDIDEASIRHGVEVLSKSIERVSRERP